MRARILVGLETSDKSAMRIFEHTVRALGGRLNAWGRFGREAGIGVNCWGRMPACCAHREIRNACADPRDHKDG